MKFINLTFVIIVFLILLNSCNKRTPQIENNFLSSFQLDFSGLEIDFELLFEYEDKQEMLKEAEDIFPGLLEEAKALINKKKEVSHVLLSFQITKGKAKLKELLIFEANQKTVYDYHNYTKKLGALEGLSANEEFLNIAFDSKVSENYLEIEAFKTADIVEEKTEVFINYLNNNYQSESDVLDLILVMGTSDLRAYSRHKEAVKKL